MSKKSLLTENSYSVTIRKAKPSTLLGVTLSSDDNGVKVSSIEPNSLAAESGLNEGDKIISINGHSVGSSHKETAELLRSSTGPIQIIASFDGELDEEALLGDDGNGFAESLSGMLGFVILVVQVVAAGALFYLFDYGSVDDFTTQQYIVFRDIMVMLLLGFGYRKFDSEVSLYY